MPLSRRTVIAMAAVASGGLAAGVAPRVAPMRAAQTPGVTTAMAAADGAELYYEVRGAGPALLMIPGGVVERRHLCSGRRSPGRRPHRDHL